MTPSAETTRPPIAGGAVYLRLLSTAGTVLALDQITKQAALERLTQGPVEVVSGALTLRLTFNSGGAFGVLQGLSGLFLIFTLVVAVAILLWARTVTDSRWLVPLGLILGGGVGNACDRLFRAFDGRVVDFIDLHVWPVFNLADSSITVGVVMVLWLGARAEEAGHGDEGAGRRDDARAAPSQPAP